MRRPELVLTLWCLFLAAPGYGATAPLIAPDEGQQFERIRKQYDADTNVVWFIPEVAPEAVTSSTFYVYFGRGDHRQLTPLRLKTVYQGKRALEVRRYWATANGKRLSLPAGAWHRERVTQVWGWLDEPLQSARQVHDLLVLAQARNAVIHFQGRGGKKQFKLSAELRRAIRDVVAAYQATGGSVGR